MSFEAASTIIFGSLLPEILVHMTTTKLIKLRLVNSTWEKEATRLLSKRNDLIIPFKFCIHTVPPTFIRWFFHPEVFYCCRQPVLEEGYYSHEVAENQSSKCMNIENYTKMVQERTTIFPNSDFFVARYRFYYSKGVLDLPEVFQFFQTVGSLIKEIQLENYSNYYLGQSGWDSNCILKHTQNLQKLILSTESQRSEMLDAVTMQRRTNDNCGQQEDLVPDFSKLKRLELIVLAPHEDKKILPLVLIAKNIESIFITGTIFPPSLISTLHNIKKIHILEMEYVSIEISDLLSNTSGTFDHLEKLASTSTDSIVRGQLIFTQKKTVPEEFRLSILNDDDNLQARIRWRYTLDLLLRFLKKNQQLQTLKLEGKVTHLFKHRRFVALLPPIKNISTIVLGCNELSLDFKETDDHPLHQVDPNDHYNFIPSEIFDGFLPPPLSSEPIFDPAAITENKLTILFPSLIKLEIFWVSGVSPRWFPYWNDVFMCVKILHLSFPYCQSKLVIPRIVNMLPFLEEVKLNNITDEFIPYACELWKLERLVKLELIVESNYSWTGNTLEFQMDKLLQLGAALLGTQRENLLQIWELWNKSGNWTNPNGPLSVFSLMSLKCFKELHLKVGGNYDARLCTFFAGLFGKLAVDKLVNFDVHLLVGPLPKSDHKSALFEKYSGPLSLMFPNVRLNF